MIKFKTAVVVLLGIIAMSILFVTFKFSTYRSVFATQIHSHIEQQLAPDLLIAINPKGYQMDNLSLGEYIGSTDKLQLVYPEAKIDDRNNLNFSSSDYLIYAKYQDTYAVITATNPIVVGGRNMNLDVYVYMQDGHPILTADFGYKHEYQPLREVIGGGITKRHAFFYDKSAYQELSETNASESQMFEHHLQMIGKLDDMRF